MPGSAAAQARYRENHPERVKAQKAAYYERNQERLRAAQRERTRLRTEAENRERAFRDRSTPRGFLNGIVSASRQRAARRGIEHSVTRDDLLLLFERQEGLCALSGLEMTTVIGQGRVRTNISLDRIDPDKGYVLSNVQLVCDFVNTMKSDLSTDEFVDVCRLVAGVAES
jgi:hypothetical protein